MNTYLLIEGINSDIEAFEQKVSDALSLGYVLAGDIKSHSGIKSGSVVFYQSMILDLEEEEELEDFDEAE